MRDFQIQTDKEVMVNQLDIVVVHSERKRAVAIAGAMLKDSYIMKRHTRNWRKTRG